MLYLKIFLISIPLILVIPIFSQKMRKNKVFRGLWLVYIGIFGFLMLLFGIAIWFYLALSSQSAGADYDLVSLSKDLEYKGTRFEYRYGSTHRIMYDPYDKFRWIYGNKPDEIFVDNNTRVIVYNKKGAIIKSKKDDIEVNDDNVHLMGWMGYSSDDAIFEADKDGVINEKKD